MKNHTFRMRGEEYLGVQKKGNKWVQDVKKPARKMGARCSCKLKTCKEVTDELCEEIFDEFWKEMTWDQKKTCVKSWVLVHPVKRRRETTVSERRSHSLVYHLRSPGRDKLIKVCKIMFLNTLNLGEWTVRGWVTCLSDSSADESEECPNPNNQVERPSTSNDTEPQVADVNMAPPEMATRRANANRFLDQLPKLESHYCRSSSTKQYLEPDWQSFAALHREYKD